jgi:acid phosphatase class B
MFRPSSLNLYMFRRYLIAAIVLSSLNACSIQNISNEHRSDQQPVSQIVKVKDLSAAIEQAKALRLRSTLVVFDIDDTLLTGTEFFGSDKLYDW